MVFYKYFNMQKTSASSKRHKNEFALICVGALIFCANLLFAIYGLLTAVSVITGGNERV